jgi:hypothetical protein
VRIDLVVPGNASGTAWFDDINVRGPQSPLDGVHLPWLAQGGAGTRNRSVDQEATGVNGAWRPCRCTWRRAEDAGTCPRIADPVRERA